MSVLIRCVGVCAFHHRQWKDITKFFVAVFNLLHNFGIDLFMC